MKVKDRTALARLALGTGARIDLDDGTAINAGRTRAKLETPSAQPAPPADPARAPDPAAAPTDADRLAAAVLEAVRLALASNAQAPQPAAWKFAVQRDENGLLKEIVATPIIPLLH